MATFLDLRTSQGSRAGAVSTTAAAPDYVAGIGLNVGTAASVRVDLEATLGIINTTTGGSNLTVTIRRYTNPGDITNFALGVPVYTQTFNKPSVFVPDAFSLSAADIAPGSPTGLLAYGLFVSVDAGHGTNYQGLQNLIGAAATNG